MDKQNKKSFLKGLLIGVGASVLTALLGITIYGCANVKANGAKAFGRGEVNICYESGDNVTATDIEHFGIKFSTFAVTGTGDNYHYFLFNTIGDWEDVLGTTDFDADAPSCVYGNFTRTGDTYYIRLNADLPSSVTFISPSFVRVYQNGSYLRDLNFVEDSSEFYSFSASGTVGFETYINLSPASSSVDFYYNQPLYDESSNSSELVSSSEEGEPYSAWSFGNGVYPAQLGLDISYGTFATFEGRTNESAFSVYIPCIVDWNGYLWDRLAIDFRRVPTDLSANDAILFRCVNGESVYSNNSNVSGKYYGEAFRLQRLRSTGSSEQEWVDYDLATCGDWVYDVSRNRRDLNMYWIAPNRLVNILDSSLDGLTQGLTPNIDRAGALEALGAFVYSGTGGGTSGGQGGGNAGDALYGVFDLIGMAFHGLTDLWSIQVLPWLTFGTCIFIPLVVIIVLGIVRLFKR